MSISNSGLVKSIEAHFTSDFEREVFYAALQSFDHEGNPLRLNNFATALRELGRIHLELEAPDGRVKKSIWFVQKTNEFGKPVIERAQRAKYAIQGELPDAFVRDTLGIEIDDVVSDYTRLIKRLSAYTHVNSKTFNLPSDDADTQAQEALAVFDELFKLVRESRETMRKAAEDVAQEALRDVLYGEVNAELDRLSTHTSVAGVYLYSLRITSMDSETIRYASRGNVDARLQYGSDSDVERGDGLVSSDSYPLTCEFSAETCSPLDVSVVSGTLVVDTNSFYESDDADLDFVENQTPDSPPPAGGPARPISQH